SQAIEEYIQSNTEKAYVVDDYTDEELYAFDLKTKYEDLTEEEIALEIEKETQHPELFKKKLDKIRAGYIALEEKEKQDAIDAELQAEKEKDEVLTKSLVEAAIAIEDIGGISLDDDD